MKLAITTTDGVSIMTLFSPAQLDSAIEKWKAVNPGKFISYREITDDDIPEDRSARKDWRDDGQTITIKED